MTSVTYELNHKDSPLRAMIRPHERLLGMWRARLLSSLSGLPWIRPPRPRQAWMSGHAIDYRARWSLTGVDNLPAAVLAGLRACSDTTRSEFLDAFATIDGTRAGVLEPELERAVCTVAVAAATIEPLYRAGAVPCALQDLGLAQFTVAYSDVIDDVIALSAGLANLFADFKGRLITAGPVVGTGWLGGDADLLAGGELVEIKCVSDPRSAATRAVQQLLVYAARLQPQAASLVLPRQHTRVVFDLGAHHGLLTELNAAIENEYGLCE